MLLQKVKRNKISESQPVLNFENSIRRGESFHTSSICSCSQCDSINCFKIRNHNSQLSCTCGKCKDTKKCILSRQTLLNKETDDNSSYKIIKKSTMDQHNNSWINIHTKNGKSEVELNGNTKYSYKDNTLITNKTDKRETSVDKSYTRHYSVAVSYDRNGEKARSQNSTATLSAQVMNLPFQEFKASLSSHKSIFSFSSNKLVKPDILTKLKEIYKACSCKVCECITGNPFYINNDNSTNETCDCGYTNNHNTQFDFKKIPHSGCPCISCDRKDCRGIVKKAIDIATCDCRPCDCVKFTESSKKPCDCEPCQCTECNNLNYRVPQSVIVVPVQGNFQQNLCQCAPCECVQCTHNYSAMTSSLMREISTGMVTQRNCDCESCLNHSCQSGGTNCRCETQNRIVRKPIGRNNRDYDLHRALIGHNSYTHKHKTKTYDTIAMYALSSNFTNSVFNSAKEEPCKCTECECIVCKDKDRHGTKIIYKNIHNSPNLFNNSFIACKCQPCECQVCGRDEITRNDTLNDTTASNKCGCEICDCMVCKGLTYCSQNNEIVGFSTNRLEYKSSVHLFENCNGFITNTLSETFFPLKKGKLLTPSMFEAKILSISQTKSQSPSYISESKKPCKSILKVNGKKLSGKMLVPVIISISHKKSSNKYVDTSYHHSSCQNMRASLSNFRNDSYIKTEPRNCKSSIAYIHDIKNNLSKNSVPDGGFRNNACNLLNNTAPSPTNVASGKSLRIDNENGASNIIYSDKPLSTCVDKISKNKLICHPNHTGERYKSTRKLKRMLNDDKDIFNAKIISFEKSISQLKEDVSRHLKTLSEIRSKDEIFNDDIADVQSIFDNTSMTKKSPNISLHNINRADPAKPMKFVEFCEEPNKIFNSINEKMEALDDIEKQSDGENLSNGDKTMYAKLIKRTQVKKRKKGLRISKTKLMKQSENIINNFINGHSTNKSNVILNTKSTCMVHEDCSVTDNRLPSIKNETAIDQSDYNNQWSVLKKGLYLNNPLVRKNKGVCTIPELEVDIKRMVESISLQTPESQVYNALTKLKLEVNDLLNSPMLQSCHKYPKYHVVDSQNSDTKPKSKLELELKYINCDTTSQTPRQVLTVEKEVNCNIVQSMEALNRDISLLLNAILTRTVYKSELTRPYSTNQEGKNSKNELVKSSCDGLKASFTGLRKVSDHTILLRWKKPSEVAEVKGYELQVDGRPVQKILNPTRCMAVLTCLPHCDKLLLTIRTLTASVVPSGHHPAATIVYCPREKHSRYSPIYMSEESRRR